MINTLSNIHPAAKIGHNVKIGAFVTIEADVEIGDGTEIGPNACILNGTRMGKNCKIFAGAIIGSIPQDLKYNQEESILRIGNNVTIREYCTINRGTAANYSTEIHDNCLIMAYCHVAHDCVIRANCVLANNVTLAGHIDIGEKTILGGLVAVHQFVRIGAHVMVGGGSLVRKDVPPYIKAAREPLSYAGLNYIGLKRRGFTEEQIHNLHEIYRILYVQGNNTTQGVAKIKALIPDCPERKKVLQFIEKADRGIIRGFRHLNIHKSSNGFSTQ